MRLHGDGRADAPLVGEILLFHNPTAGIPGRAALVERLVRMLVGRHWKVLLVTERDELRRRAGREAAGSGEFPEAVIVAGGDGTVRLVADTISPEIPVAVFPLGTENLLAKYLQMTADPQTLIAALEARATTQLDVGRANGRLFLVMVGCGFDAEVVHRLHAERQGHIRHWSYAKPILSVLRSYRYPELTVSWQGGTGPAASGEGSTTAHWAFVFNVPSYAGALPIAPQADPSDGQLDVVTFSGGSLWHGVYHLASVLMGTHRARGAVVQRPAQRVTIRSPHQVRFQLDGDPGGLLPVDIQVIPQCLKVVVPGDWHRSQTVAAPAADQAPLRG